MPVRLRDNQYRAILDLVGEAHDAQDLDELRGLLLPSLRRMVPADYASYNEITAHGDTPVMVMEPSSFPPHLREVWDRYAMENPLIVRHFEKRDTRPYRFSDVIDMRDLRRTNLYRELYKPLGVEHQIAFALPSPPTLTIGIALSRGGRRDFGDDERTMLDLARPHLIQAYRNAQMRERLGGAVEALGAGIDVRGAGALVVEPSGTVMLATERARNLVREVTGAQVRKGQPPPPPLDELVRGGRSGRPLRTGEGEPVLAHVVRATDGTAALLIETAAKALPASALRGLGLTAREADVLAHLARGLSTSETARLLGTSPRTVEKHAERIHRKLGVTNRAQAVATAWAAVVASNGSS